MLGRVDLEPGVEPLEVVVVELVSHLLLEYLYLLLSLNFLLGKQPQLVLDMLRHVFSQEFHLALSGANLPELANGYFELLEHFKGV